MNTVNVIEITDVTSMSVAQLVAFDDTVKGNHQAEALFVQLLVENYPDIPNDDMEIGLEEGYFTLDNYYVGIVHSTPSSHCSCGGRFKDVMVTDSIGKGLHSEIQCNICGKEQ